MVARQVNPRACRPSSGQDASALRPQSPVSMAYSEPFDMSMPHFAVIYIDRSKRLGFYGSSSICRPLERIFTQNVCEKFLGSFNDSTVPRTVAYAGSESSNSSVSTSSASSASESNSLYRSPRVTKRRLNHIGTVSRQSQKKRASKRSAGSKGRKPGPKQAAADELDIGVDNLNRTPIYVEIGDRQAIDTFYHKAWKAFQQINCRIVAKQYVKVIEPRKQVKHPYNGGKPTSETKGDASLTKPEWWPADIRHKEPDHLKTPERIALLNHIFRKLRKPPFGITSKMLKESTQEFRRALKPPERWDILQEIYRVNDIDYRYTEGHLDEHFKIPIEPLFVNEPDVKDEDDEDDDSPTPKDLERSTVAVDEHLIAQADESTFLEPNPSNLTSPMNYMDISKEQSYTMAEDQTNPLFPVVDNIGFREHPRSAISYPTSVVAKREYLDDYSPEDTYSTGRAASLHDFAAAQTSSTEFPTRNIFARPTQDEIRFHDQARRAQASVSHPHSMTDGWSPTCNAHCMFRPVEYVVISSQVPQPILPTHPSAHPQGIGQGRLAHQHSSIHGLPLPDMAGARVQPSFDASTFNGSSFRTGSLSHPHHTQHPDDDNFGMDVYR